MTVPTTPPWKRLYGDVKTNLPAITDAVYEHFLFQVVEDFLEMTNVWTEEVPIPVVPNVLTYNFAVTKGAPFRLLLLYDPKVSGPEKRWVGQNVQMTMPGTITVGYAPSEATTWNAVIAKTLDEPANGTYPDMGDGIWIIDKNRGTLCDGILGLLLMSPAKPYSNMKMGQQRWQWYIAGRSRERANALKANVYGAQRWQYPQTFATVRRGGWT